MISEILRLRGCPFLVSTFEILNDRLPGCFVHFLAHFGAVKKTDEAIGSEKVLCLTEGKLSKAFWAMPL